MLFAALLLPWFINWDDYKTSFEQQAGRILGHPVRVIGSADASILPSPALAFTSVMVGDPGDPMMTVDRFDVTIELLPLLQGEIRVVAMTLERPALRLDVDGQGEFRWLDRAEGSEALEPDKVVLGAVDIRDGTISYRDSRAGVSMDFAGINASVEARSLAGPWRVDGSYIEGEAAVPFHFATGRWLDSGGIRVRADFSPAQFPVSVSADGVLARDPAWGLAYTGTYALSELVENKTGEITRSAADEIVSGWRSEGAFTLNQDRLSIEKAVISNGPAAAPSGLAGSLVIEFGAAASFRASAEARQVDVDRALGGGPNEPVLVREAAADVISWLSALPHPSIPGRIAVAVPAMVVGGALLQDVALKASSTEDGWIIEQASARLPGQTEFTAKGVVSTGRGPAFRGRAAVSIQQPAIFAGWWGGQSAGGAGRALEAIDLSGNLEVSAQRFLASDMRADIGASSISGQFSWNASARNGGAEMGSNLRASRLDVAQMLWLAELVVGKRVGATDMLADSFKVILVADEMRYDDIILADVSVDASYADDILHVTQFAVGDIGGASFKITGGQVEGILTSDDPRGLLDANLEVRDVGGLASLAGKFLPDSGLQTWLKNAADVITPAVLKARVGGVDTETGGGLYVTVEDAVAGDTVFSLKASTAGGFRSLRDAQAAVELKLHSPDAGALVRQLGVSISPSQQSIGADVSVSMQGIPADGPRASMQAAIGETLIKADGSLSLLEENSKLFAGKFSVSTQDISALSSLVGFGQALAGSVAIEGSLSFAPDLTSVVWRNGEIEDRRVSGDLEFAGLGQASARMTGHVTVDQLDLGWLMAVGLGEPVLPNVAEGGQWSNQPFAATGYGPLSGTLSIDAERFQIASDIAPIRTAKISATLQPHRMEVDLTEGSLVGGAATGSLSIYNVEGNVRASASFNLSGAALDDLVWRRDGRAIAAGKVDLSANIDATGNNPSGLVASMTGGGAISLRNGEVHYVNPNAGRLIVRAWDLGQEFTEDALRIVIGEQMDADSLVFDEVDGNFEIAGGTLRLGRVSVSQNDVEASGRATINFNTLSLDSDWTLSFDPGDDKVEAIDPKIGLVFQGSLAEPARYIDTLAFAAYLNARREVFTLERITAEEATNLERERLARLMVKLRQDRERRERLANEAAAAEARREQIAAAVAERLAVLAIARQVEAEDRADAEARRAVQQAVEARDAAVALADMARQEAEAASSLLENLLDELKSAVKRDEEAASVLQSARSQLEAHEAELRISNERAARAAADNAAAQDALSTAIGDSKAARAVAADAERSLSAARAEHQLALKTLEGLRLQLDEARTEVRTAQDTLKDARAALSAVQEEQTESSAAAIDAATAALDNARALAEARDSAVREAERDLREADAHLNSLQLTAQKTAEEVSLAEKAKEEAVARVAAATRDFEQANTAYRNAVLESRELTPASEHVALSIDRLRIAREAAASAGESVLNARTAADNARASAEDARKRHAAMQQAAERAKSLAAEAQSERSRLEAELDRIKHVADNTRVRASDAGKAFHAAEERLQKAIEACRSAESALAEAEAAFLRLERVLEQAQQRFSEAAERAALFDEVQSKAGGAATEAHDTMESAAAVAASAESALNASREAFDEARERAEAASQARLLVESRVANARREAAKASDAARRALQEAEELSRGIPDMGEYVGEEADVEAKTETGRLLTDVPVPRFPKRPKPGSAGDFLPGTLEIDQPMLLVPLN